MLSHLFVHGVSRDRDFVHDFLVEFSDLLPTCVQDFRKSGHNSPALFASFLPDSDDCRIVAAFEDGIIRIWNLTSGRRIFSFRQEEKLKSFACSADGLHAVSVSHNGIIHVWDLANRASDPSWEGTCPRGTLGPVNFLPNGNLIISAFEAMEDASGYALYTWEARLQDLNTSDQGGHRSLLGPTTNQRLVTMSPEAQTYFSSSHLLFWDPRFLALHSQLLDRDVEYPTCVAFSQDGRFVACGRRKDREDPKTHHWVEAVVVIYVRAEEYHSHKKNELQLWDDSGFIPLVTLMAEEGTNSSVKTLAFSSDGERLVSGGRDGHIRIWDTQNWYEMVNFKEHQNDVNAVAFSSVDRMVSCSDDGVVRIWNTKAVLSGPALGRTYSFIVSSAFTYAYSQDTVSATLAEGQSRSIRHRVRK
ncbi:hypothetical protein EIP86_003051 [Pleurotus ostreatoroseus]|nr:hypothetical protein EIP86_003051 [Pleurotus ostreatoroseus]